MFELKARAYKQYDVDLVSNEGGIDCSQNDPSQDVQGAHQEFKDECDINVIIAKHEAKNVPLPASRVEAVFGDFSDSTDWHGKLNAIHEANEAFMELPAKIRSRFGNDPGKLLEFLHDPANRSEAQELGIVDYGDSKASVPGDKQAETASKIEAPAVAETPSN